jgi:hypothetical protein
LNNEVKMTPHPALRATFSHKGRRKTRHGLAQIILLPLWEKVRQGMRGLGAGALEAAS